MRRWVVLVCVLIFAALAAAQRNAKSYEPGTVMSVEKLEPNDVSYRKITDAPLRSSGSVYNISVQVAGNVIVGRYASASDYLPSMLTQGKSVSVRTDKHRMYLKEPFGEDIELPVVSHRRIRKQE